MAKPTDHPGFRQLQIEWYAKLTESGFEDIESSNEDRALYKSGTIKRVEKMDSVHREIRSQFYSILQDRLSQIEIQCEQERAILYLYAQGVSPAAIQTSLQLTGSRRNLVYHPIYKWLKKLGLR